ncbi:unnamed protein product [Moneuplotes crassus]|uniref:Uncharacterized protein n=1 Tax=Euplotes crassus TaxID=5936 RepID=A0AAD2D7W9_EUPCR|nr:unnamed protein product [Moneuplotes crassus]
MAKKTTFLLITKWTVLLREKSGSGLPTRKEPLLPLKGRTKPRLDSYRHRRLAMARRVGSIQTLLGHSILRAFRQEGKPLRITKSEALKRGINYNACVEALNQIQKSIKVKKITKRRGTGHFQNSQRTFEPCRVKNYKDDIIKQKCEDIINTLVFDSKEISRESVEESRKIPPHVYDSCSQRSHGKNKITQPPSFGPITEPSMQQNSSIFDVEKLSGRSQGVRNRNKKKVVYSTTYDRIRDKASRSLSPDEPTPKFNKKFKKYLDKRKDRFNQFDHITKNAKGIVKPKGTLKSRSSLQNSSVQERRYRPRILSLQERRSHRAKEKRTLYQIKRDQHKSQKLHSSKASVKRGSSIGRDSLSCKRSTKDFSQFFQKNLDWQKQRNKNIQKLKKNFDQEKQKECTFQPNKKRKLRSLERKIKPFVSKVLESCKKQMRRVRSKRGRLYSPTNAKGFEDTTQFLRFDDCEEINILPGAAEISGEIEEIEVDENYLGNYEKEEKDSHSDSRAINLLDSFNKIKEEEDKQEMKKKSYPLKSIKLKVPTENKSSVKINVNSMKPPIPHGPIRRKSASPLSKITEKDETNIAITESLDFTAHMEGIDEISKDPSFSIHHKSSVEKTQLLNGPASFDFEEFNSGDFQEHSIRSARSTIMKSKGRVEEYCSSISCASVTSDSAHAQNLFPTNAQRVTLVQMKNNEHPQNRETMVDQNSSEYSYDEEVLMTESIKFCNLRDSLLDQYID